MSMLAEKKSRTKWCLNPMGNDWAKDENKFGLKMLQKMGWEPGSGLGARGQGIKEFVKLKFKADSKGLGCLEKNTSNNWTKNLETFDQLLAELNGETEKESIVLNSLEEKSKSSKARVHYHKFTRGKDVSKYSPKDLNCILPILSEKKGEEDEPGQIVNNNMYEYFNTKTQNPFKNKSENKNLTDFTENGMGDSLNSEDTFEMKITKKKRKNDSVLEIDQELDFIATKKKKKSKDSNYDEVVELHNYNNFRSESNDHTNGLEGVIKETALVPADPNDLLENNDSNISLKKKKKKSVRFDIDSIEESSLCFSESNYNSFENQNNILTTENQGDISCPEKTKKKKKKSLPQNNYEVAQDTTPLNDTTCNNSSSSHKKKKKRKSEQQNDSDVEDASQCYVSSNGTSCNNYNNICFSENASDCSSKPKKKRKNKSKQLDIDNVEDSNQCKGTLSSVSCNNNGIVPIKNVSDKIENGEVSSTTKKKKRKYEELGNVESTSHYSSDSIENDNNIISIENLSNVIENGDESSYIKKKRKKSKPLDNIEGIEVSQSDDYSTNSLRDSVDYTPKTELDSNCHQRNKKKRKSKQQELETNVTNSNKCTEGLIKETISMSDSNCVISEKKKKKRSKYQNQEGTEELS